MRNEETPKQYALLLGINYWSMLAAAAQKKGLRYIAKLDDSRQSAFLIQDMFPITD